MAIPSALAFGFLATSACAVLALDPSKPPAGNFELSIWALQLPVASGSSVQQIKPADLMAGYIHPSYFSTGSDGSMTFWCPVTGATTQNSHYPRSELRETPQGGDWKFDGLHVLTAKCRVTQVPDDGKLIMGQIHGSQDESEIIKLYWDNGDVTAGVEPNRSSENQLALGKFKLGDTLSYEIQMQDGKLKVTVNGKSVTQDYTAATWKTDAYYFKAGSYVQDNTGSSSVGGRVQFYQLQVAHNGKVVSLIPGASAVKASKARASGILINGPKAWISMGPSSGGIAMKDFLGRGFSLP